MSSLCTSHVWLEHYAADYLIDAHCLIAGVEGLQPDVKGMPAPISSELP